MANDNDSSPPLSPDRQHHHHPDPFMLIQNPLPATNPSSFLQQTPHYTPFSPRTSQESQPPLWLQDLQHAMAALTPSQQSPPSLIPNPHSSVPPYFSTLEELRQYESFRLRLENLRVQLATNVTDSVLPRQRYRNGFGSTLEGLRGKIASIARDHCGCRFLQMKIDAGRPEEISMILSEIKDHVHELMTNKFGNYLIQKIFEATTIGTGTIDRVLCWIVLNEHKLKHVCTNEHGTRAVQKMLENLRSRVQVATTVCMLRRITVPLMKNVNGGYVIQQCVQLFPLPCKKAILDEVAMNCVDVATDKNGCSVIQKCLEMAQGDAIRLLVEEIISNAAILAADPYGNYVVQFVLTEMSKEKPTIISCMVSRLHGKYVELSMNKHASHVVENLLQSSDEMDNAAIVMEIADSHELLNLLQDSYGNYVAQKALIFSSDYVYKILVDNIVFHYTSLRDHPFGKKVLQTVKHLKNRV